MPQRILRDWTESEKIDNISFQAEVLFVRLIMKADDYGSFHANPRLVKANCFPLKDIRESDITRFLNELKDAGLIALYEAENKSYLNITDFGQRLRTMKRKFPEMTATCGQMSVTCQQPAAENMPEEEVEEEEEYEEEEEGEGAARQLPFSNKGDVLTSSLDAEERKEKSSAKKEKKQIPPNSAEIITYLNQVCQKDFKAIESNARHINARFSEGYTVDDLKMVIEMKFYEWHSDARWSAYLRPQTLFNSEKFPGYIAHARALQNNPKLMEDARKQFAGSNSGGSKQTHAQAADVLSAVTSMFKR